MHALSIVPNHSEDRMSRPKRAPEQPYPRITSVPESHAQPELSQGGNPLIGDPPSFTANRVNTNHLRLLAQQLTLPLGDAPQHTLADLAPRVERDLLGNPALSPKTVETRRCHHRRLYPRFANHLLEGSWLDVAQTIYAEFADQRPTASLIVNTLLWELHFAARLGMRSPGDAEIGPLAKVFANPRTRWLSPEQCAKVDDALDELAQTRLYGSCVDALRCCMLLPLRSGAIFRLQWSQIGGDFESLTVVDKGKPRTWAVGSVVRELLARRRRDARAASWVFWGRPVTQHIHPTTVRSIFLKALAIAKIDPTGVSVHTLRHSLATNLLRDGEAVETAQRALGHSSPKITEQYYLHHVPTRARVAVESLNLKVISLKARKAQ